MASVFQKGPKTAPRFFARYLDVDGVWRSKRVRVDKRSDAMKIARALEAKGERIRHGLEPREGAAITVGELLARWQNTLRNRSWAHDVSRVRVHLMPRWGSVRLADATLAAVLGWIEEMRAAAKLAPGTQRGLLGVLSRAFSWAVVSGLMNANPVKALPVGSRPQATPTASKWIEDDTTAPRLMAALPEAIGLAFYLAFGSGMRQGEVFALRMGDLDGIDEGAILVTSSWGGPLKEDKHATGKTKHVPAPADLRAVLGPWLGRRRAAGAGPGDLVFVGEDGRAIQRAHVAYRWTLATRTLGLEGLKWHCATRTSFSSRAARAGVPIDQIASALGHASIATTQRSYMKWTRKTFDPRLTSGLAAQPGAKVFPIATARTSGAAFDDSAERGDEHAA
jgi:integrase